MIGLFKLLILNFVYAFVTIYALLYDRHFLTAYIKYSI